MPEITEIKLTTINGIVNVLVMNDKEDIKIAQFNMNEIRQYRSRETLADAYRKPYAYTRLIEDSVQEPFIREDSRRNYK